ncbi:hypothetical protein F5883DRAFT_571491 [Diaporthe sp. PMI_573]|nr:hypothetical protein F5883DRAFT_571491 [Diaporthaceae sp. PMI_573]
MSTITPDIPKALGRDHDNTSQADPSDSGPAKSQIVFDTFIEEESPCTAVENPPSKHYQVSLEFACPQEVLTVIPESIRALAKHANVNLYLRGRDSTEKDIRKRLGTLQALQSLQNLLCKEEKSLALMLIQGSQGLRERLYPPTGFDLLTDLQSLLALSDFSALERYIKRRRRDITAVLIVEMVWLHFDADALCPHASPASDSAPGPGDAESKDAVPVTELLLSIDEKIIMKIWGDRQPRQEVDVDGRRARRSRRPKRGRLHNRGHGRQSRNGRGQLQEEDDLNIQAEHLPGTPTSGVGKAVIFPMGPSMLSHLKSRQGDSRTR